MRRLYNIDKEPPSLYNSSMSRFGNIFFTARASVSLATCSCYKPIAKGHCSIFETSARLLRLEELEVKRKFVFLKGSYPKTRIYFSVADSENTWTQGPHGSRTGSRKWWHGILPKLRGWTAECFINTWEADNLGNNVPLILCYKEGFTLCVVYLLDQGADTNTRII